MKQREWCLGLVMAHLPRGPPTLLKDSWCDTELPISPRLLHIQLEDSKVYAQVEPVVYDSSCFVGVVPISVMSYRCPRKCVIVVP